MTVVDWKILHEMCHVNFVSFDFFGDEELIKSWRDED